MPRRGTKNSGFNGNTGDILTIRGHAVLPYMCNADPSGAQRFVLHPSAIDNYRLIDMLQIYEQYRFMKLKATFIRALGDGASSAALVAYTPCKATTAASNSITLSAVDQMAFTFPAQTTRTVLKIPRLPLHGPLDWYECSDVNSGPGEMWISILSDVGTGVAGTILVQFDYEIAFNGRNPTAITATHAWLGRVPAQSGVDDDDTSSTDSVVTVTTSHKKRPKNLPGKPTVK